MEIAFENVNAADQIQIRTENSVYQFSVVDPAERTGILSGGSLRNQNRDAVLVGSLASEPDSRMYLAGLKTGYRALFYLETRNGVERLVTSIVTDLSRRERRADKQAA